ncbi:MAG: hypothetical protein IT424_12150 [Pirellulales bacterium]|nr:hypothetical protein [Pirellulales bacterium]
MPLTTAIAPAAESASPHQEKSPAETRRAEIRRRKRRMLTISVVLGVLALVMAVILIVVLSRPSKAAPFAVRNLPAAAGLWLAN